MQYFQETYLPLILLIAPALITGLAMAISGAAVGTLVLLRREALLALALPQVVLFGAAIGLRYLEPLDPPTNEWALWTLDHVGWPTLPPAVVAVFAALVLVALSRSRQGERAGGTRAATLVLPAIYVAATASAILVVKNAGNHLVDVQNRYVGIDIAVDDHLAEITAPALIICGLVAGLFWRRWLLIAQAPSAAQLAGLQPARWDALFLTLLSIVILLGTNALGAVTVMALLFLPPAAVLPWARRVPGAIVAAITLAVFVYGGGFVLSTEMDWPLGQSVGGLGGVVFLISYMAAAIRGMA